MAGDDESPGADNNPATGVQSRYVHSDIFDRLVEADDDLTGLVAYGLYQRQKRKWIANFEKDRGRVPSEQEVKDYCYGFHDEVLHDLITKADSIIFGVCEGLIESRIPEMQSSAFNAQTTSELGILKVKIEEISGYKHHIVGHVFGFVVLVVVAWLALFIRAHEPRIEDFLGLTEIPKQSPGQAGNGSVGPQGTSTPLPAPDTKDPH